MYDKTYLQYRTEYLLQKAIDAEIEKLKNSIRYNANTDISNRCTADTCEFCPMNAAYEKIQDSESSDEEE